MYKTKDKFITWLQTRKEEESPLGDLARDAMKDRWVDENTGTVVEVRTLEDLETRMFQLAADQASIETLEKAKDYFHRI